MKRLKESAAAFLDRTGPFVTGESGNKVVFKFGNLDDAQMFLRLVILEVLTERGEEWPGWAKEHQAC